jgi:hypothetical protein
MTDMTDKSLFIEEKILNSVKKLLTGGRARPAKAGRPLSGTVACIVRQPRLHLRQNALPGACTGRVNELLGETEYSIPPVEFGNYWGGSSVFPVITLSACERSEKERIIRLDAYTLTIAFTVPEHPAGDRNCYAYAAAIDRALSEDPALGGAAGRADHYRGGRAMTVQGCDCLIVIKTQYREMQKCYAFLRRTLRRRNHC